MSTLDPLDYEYWLAALAGEKPAVHDGKPQCGYYAYKLASGPRPNGSNRWPVAVYRNPNGDGSLLCMRGTKEAWEWTDPVTLWSYIAAHPISEKLYESAFAEGRFPDDLPAEALAPPSVGSLGRNASGPIDEAEVFAKDVLAAANAAKAMVVVDDVGLAAMQSMRAKLNELKTSGKKRHEAEKDEPWKLCKAIDAKWLPYVKTADDASGRLGSLMSTYITQENRRRMQAMADAAAATALQQTAEANAAAEGAVYRPNAPVEPLPAFLPPIAGVKGGYGRAAAVKALKIANIADHAAFVGAILAGRFGAEVTANFKGVLQGMANTIVNANITDVPGVTTEDGVRVQ